MTIPSHKSHNNDKSTNIPNWWAKGTNINKKTNNNDTSIDNSLISPFSSSPTLEFIGLIQGELDFVLFFYTAELEFLIDIVVSN